MVLTFAKGTPVSEEHRLISACILARNEERRIEDALRSLLDWTDEIIVLDNESDDRTAAVARRYADRILTVPRSNNFDAARNLAVDHASGEWIFFLDADERVPPALGRLLRQLVTERGHEFEALMVPFKNHFCGKWMEHSGWWPGYSRPQLLKKGRFRYGVRLHSGVEVDGRTLRLPSDDPSLAITHYSYEDLHHYLEKINRYTDGEAENLLADGASHSWQAQLAHFVHDWQMSYEDGRGDLDGMHGFVLSFMSAFYRFASRAKLWDLRRKSGELPLLEPVPGSVREMLELMARVSQEGAGRWLAPPPAASPRVPLLWFAPLLDPSGYADEARNFVLALWEAGEPLAVCPNVWNDEDAGLSQEVRALIARHAVPIATPSEIFVSQTTPPLHRPHPNALVSVARTMFETDRLQPGWEAVLNRMDRVWVPSEFNRRTFVRSGVDAERITVIPEAIDPAPFARRAEPWPVPGGEPFKFLSIFDWTLRKGWDVLLEAFASEFGGDSSVGLVIKASSSCGYSLEDIRAQADALLRRKVGKGLCDLPNIHIWQQWIPSEEMSCLYHAADCFALPTRGEGWGRPLMEAMASGLPTIATAWSGLTAFHDAAVGYPLKYALEPVTKEGEREIPIFEGHEWAEPDAGDLRRLMRKIVDHPAAARRKGRAAQKRVAERYSRPAVAAALRQELEYCRSLAARKASAASTHPPSQAAFGPLLRLPANRMPADPLPDVSFAALLGRQLRVRWEGDFGCLSSLARVNRELCLKLLERGDVELSIAEGPESWPETGLGESSRCASLLSRRGAPLSGPPDVTVRHRFPPDWTRPAEGKLIVMQPWEWGHLPAEWARGAIEGADEVWAYSRFVRDVYARSGVPAEKVRITPLGFDPGVFTPEGPKRDLPTAKSIRFLFAGGAIGRKGADLLLQAYRRSFTRDDDVCLVVKDMGARTFYQGQGFGEELRRAQEDPGGPEVLYLDDDLSDADMAALYRACACVILPYRGEGFGLSPLEGMACGLPAIVTAGGPTDDYLDDATALRVPARKRRLGHRQVGPWECVGDPWNLEPDLDALADALRWVRDHPDQARERGEAAAASVRDDWTWGRAARAIRLRLAEAVAPARDREIPPAMAQSGETASERGDSAECEREDSAQAEKLARKEKRQSRKEPIELSLCMIARDEEDKIGACLRSIAPYVDEMIVVDTGSTDRTREAARECGARVFDLPWPDSFAEARNRSLELARGRWIFWMDADDVIAPECGERLRDLIRVHPDGAAFQVGVRIPPGPGESTSSLVDHVKLFPHQPELRFEHRIHEQILPALRRAGMPVHPTGLTVTHAHYDRSPEGQAKKRRRDFRLLEMDLADRPEHPFTLFNLGMTHLYAAKEYEVAAQYLRRSLNASDPHDSIVRKAYALLTSARIGQEEWEEALRENEEGRRHYPDDAELLFQAGQLYQRLGRFAEARTALERLVGGSEEAHYRSVDEGLRTCRGRHEMALLFRRMGDAEHCVQILREVAEAHPEYAPAKSDLAEALHGLGRQNEAEEILCSAAPASTGSAESLEYQD